MSPQPVLIVGGGPTGLVLAIELARRGVPFHLVDRHDRPLRWDRATVVKARSLEVFAGMGVAEAFVRHGRVLRGVDLFSRERHVASYGFERLDSPFPFMLSIPEDETERILADRLAQLGGRIERGLEFVGLAQEAGAVHARVRSRDGGERMLEASWVVGTDGVHSAVREAVGDALDGHDLAGRLGVVDARLSAWSRPDDRAAIQLEPPIVNPIPLPDGRWRIYFQHHGRDEDVLPMVRARLAATSPGVELQAADLPRLFVTHSRVARRYRMGRVLLAGDAAHACSPLEAHGMNTGIQDAYNLGWKLALVMEGAAPESLLDSYEAERRPIAQAVARSGDEAHGRLTDRDGAGRDGLVRLLASPEGRAAAAIAESEIAFGYDASPIVEQIVPEAWPATDTPIGHRVGDAGPLVERGRTCSLHELVGTGGHTLLLLLGDAEGDATLGGLALAHALHRRHGPHLQAFVVTRNVPPNEHLLHDPTGALHRRLGAEPPSLCLVRPDGHLGLRLAPPSPERLGVHLRRILRGT